MQKEQNNAGKTDFFLDYWADQARAFQSVMTNLNGNALFGAPLKEGRKSGDDAQEGSRNGSSPLFFQPGYMEAVWGIMPGFSGAAKEAAGEYVDDMLQAGVRAFLKSGEWFKDTGHIGIYVSARFQKEFSPVIAAWLKEREPAQGSGPRKSRKKPPRHQAGAAPGNRSAGEKSKLANKQAKQEDSVETAALLPREKGKESGAALGRETLN